MERSDKIFLGAVAGILLGTEVARARLRRSRAAETLASFDPELADLHEANRPRFLDAPCPECGALAGYRERQGIRLEPRVVEDSRLNSPVLQDQRVLFTYQACRNCGAAR